MKKIIALTLALSLALALAGCGSEAAPAESRHPENVSGGVQLANPYVTCADEADMEARVGFEVTLPEELPAWVEETVYRAMPGELAEIIYRNEENEIRVRIAEGDGDISGVYGLDGSYEEELSLEDRTVHVSGEKPAEGEVQLYMATWTADGRTCSVTSPQGVPGDELLAVVQAVR